MGFKAIRESFNRNRREMGDQDAKRRKLKEKKRVFDLAKHGLNKHE